MTSREAFAEAVHLARRFRYIPDSEGPDDWSSLLADEWDTVEEFETRGGGDCDGYALWTAQWASEACTEPGAEFYVIAGIVKQHGRWLGHAWCGALYPDHVEEWADSAWGLDPGSPGALGYPTTRKPRQRWTHAGGGHFDRPHQYDQ